VARVRVEARVDVRAEARGDVRAEARVDVKLEASRQKAELSNTPGSSDSAVRRANSVSYALIRLFTSSSA
jgi:hypothetical protein